MVTYCCYIPEGKGNYSGQHGTSFSRLFIRYLLSLEEIESMEGWAGENLEGRLRAREKKQISWVRLLHCKENYRQVRRKIC